MTCPGPKCSGGYEGTLCHLCEREGVAQCPSCDEYAVGCAPGRYTCGCLDEEAVCPDCAENRKGPCDYCYHHPDPPNDGLRPR